MKTLTLATALALAVSAAGCASHQTRVTTSAGEVDLPPVTTSVLPPVVSATVSSDLDASSAYVDRTMDLNERVRVLDGRAAAIDDQLPGSGAFNGLIPLTLTDVQVTDDAFRDVTDERWSHMQMWYDGTNLSKLRMLPGLDRNDTEEFYYNDGKLIMVYWDPNGIGGGQYTYGMERPESFYFGQEGLISWVRGDGTTADPNSADFQYWDGQLRREATRFPDGGLRSRRGHR